MIPRLGSVDVPTHGKLNELDILNDQVQTCASLSDPEFIDRRLSLFRRNFGVIAQQKLQQTLEEQLQRIDHCTEKILTKLPKEVRKMTVSEFLKKHESGISGLEFTFEPPPKTSKRSREEDRDSGEAFRKRVRQQLAETREAQKLDLPGTRAFMQLPEQQRDSVIKVLSAVVATYREVHNNCH